MACRYVFTEEQIQELANAVKANKRKDADRRLQALLMRANGNKLAEIAQATGYSFSNITKLVRTYREGGVAAIVENHYRGNHQNMSYEEEAALLKPFEKKAEAGQMVEISEIKAAYHNGTALSLSQNQLTMVLPPKPLLRPPTLKRWLPQCIPTRLRLLSTFNEKSV